MAAGRHPGSALGRGLTGFSLIASIAAESVDDSEVVDVLGLCSAARAVADD